MSSFFRSMVESAVETAHCTLGICADYYIDDDAATVVPDIYVNVHSTNTELFQNIELDERQVHCSIKKTDVPAPSVGDYFIDKDTGHKYEIDGNIHETITRTQCVVRADWQYA